MVLFPDILAEMPGVLREEIEPGPVIVDNEVYNDNDDAVAAAQNYDVMKAETHGKGTEIDDIFNGDSLPNSEEINELPEVETMNHGEAHRDGAIVIDEDDGEKDEIGNSRGERMNIFNEINLDVRQQSRRVPTKNCRYYNEDMMNVSHEGGGSNGIISSELNTDRTPRESDDKCVVATVIHYILAQQYSQNKG